LTGAAFNSDKTPAFGQMLSTLFNNSTGDQKAGMINRLLSSVSPGTLTQILSGAGPLKDQATNRVILWSSLYDRMS
jgi:hypothetical protein